jgi:AcrR family transcriptional regulator
MRRLQKGGIYRHFRNKEELAAAAFDHAWALASQTRWLDIDRDTNAIRTLPQRWWFLLWRAPSSSLAWSGGDQSLNAVRSYLDEFLQTLESERTVPRQR